VKPIRLSRHAGGYTAKRGFTREEVEQVIRQAPWEPADWGEGRLQATREFPYGQTWNGRFYTTKQVRPVFVETDVEIVVVTVYTYYYGRPPE
jgi:hypothetical protein